MTAPQPPRSISPLTLPNPPAYLHRSPALIPLTAHHGGRRTGHSRGKSVSFARSSSSSSNEESVLYMAGPPATLKNARRGRGMSVSFAQSENMGSEDSVLYMAGPPAQKMESGFEKGRKRRQSLSSIGNRGTREGGDGTSEEDAGAELEGPATVRLLIVDDVEKRGDKTGSEDGSGYLLPKNSPRKTKAKSEAYLCPKEEARNREMIDQEVIEWQEVCRSGRPSWYFNSRPYADTSPTGVATWEKGEDIYNIDHETSCTEEVTNDDLAKTIAIRLLGSCFTLPVDFDPAERRPRPPRRSADDTKEYLISSLRMHTHWRHTPAFGYEQRNVSPSYSAWPSSHNLQLDIAPDRGLGVQTPIIGSSGSVSHRRRPRYSHSSHGKSYDGAQGSEGDPERPRDIRTNYSLQPVLRSEPHPVYVQPVRELVVKRWRSFRRRFGGSLCAPLPDGDYQDGGPSRRKESTGPSHQNREDQNGIGDVEVESVGDGRSRRLMAQEEGEIGGAGEGSGSIVEDEKKSVDFKIDDAEEEEGAMEVPNEVAVDEDAVIPRIFQPRVDKSQATGLDEHVLSGAEKLSHFEERIKASKSRRKSTLSEMWSAQDDGPSSEPPLDVRPEIMHAESSPAVLQAEPHNELAPHSLKTTITSTTKSFIGVLSRSHRREAVDGTLVRRSLTRTSTSGTQVFRPADDGVEVDGLPVGPGREIWGNERAGRRERTYL